MNNFSVSALEMHVAEIEWITEILKMCCVFMKIKPTPSNYVFYMYFFYFVYSLYDITEVAVERINL